MAYETKGEMISVFIDVNKPSLDKFSLASTISHELVHVFQYLKYPYILQTAKCLETHPHVYLLFTYYCCNYLAI